jgi:putative flippase GtrA
MKFSLPFLYEFFRYAVVGGVAFLADLCSLVVSREFFLRDVPCGVYISVAIGFVVGLVVNYSLSITFVFTDRKYENKGRTISAFAIFAVIGVVGFFLTELGMWIGVGLLDCNYGIVKVFVAAAVLFWNYLGRKFIVFGK